MSTTISGVSASDIKALGNVPLTEDMYTKGQVETRLDAISAAVADEIASAISTVWKAGGSKSATDLIQPGAVPGTRALLIKENEGKVYNMSTSGTTDAFFVEGAGKPYTAGTDIAVINTGTTSSPVYKFNVLAAQDSSVVKSVNGYTPTNGAVTIPEATYSGDGIMSSGDKSKLDNIASGAEINQNAFSNIAVSGETTVAAGSKTDTLTLLAGDNVTITTNATNGSVTIAAEVPESVVQSFLTDSGDATPYSGVIDIHGSGGVSVFTCGASAIIVDASDISGVASGAASGVTALSGVVSGLKNFSKVTVVDSTGTAVTNGTLTPSSNADDTLKLKAGDNVTLSVAANTKTVSISATGSVTGAKISGVSSLSSGSAFSLSGNTIVVPTAATGGYGVAKLTNTIDSTSGTAVTPYAVSGAISGLASNVNQTLNGYVGGSGLHSGLVAKSLSNPSSWSGNTIYALLAALHSVDGQSES